MRCLTVRQPWAWAIAAGAKDVENRAGSVGFWKRAEGEVIAIHSGVGWSLRGQRDERVRRAWHAAHGRSPDFDGGPSLPRPERIAGHLMPVEPLGPAPLWFGCVLCLAEVAEVHPAAACGGACSPWAETSYEEADGRVRSDVIHLRLADALPLRDPMPAVGRLGLWEPDDDLQCELAARLLEGVEIVEG